MRRFLAATVAAALLIPVLATAPAHAEPAARAGDTAAGAPRGHARPIPGATPVKRTSTKARALTTSTASVLPDCTTSKYTDPAGTGVLRVDEGCDLDWYMFESDGPLDFSIVVDRYAGPVDADGHPAAGHDLKGRTALLTLRAWDVDDDYVGSDNREIDYVYVNGQQIPPPSYGLLIGANNQWSTMSFQIGTDALRFPSAAGEVAVNDFHVKIDIGNPGMDRWAVEVDWAELRLSSDVLPVALMHGITGDGSSMNDIKGYYEQAMWQLGGKIITPSLTRNGSTQENARLMHQPITDLLERTGAAQVNLVAHSMGGLNSRRYAWLHPGTIRNIVMIATPNGGSEVADHLCTVRNSNYLDPDYVSVINSFTQSFGDCSGPEDGLYQLQTSYMREVYNAQVRDNATRTTYATIAGEGLHLTSPYSVGRNDGVVTIDSVRWMAQDGPNGGVHLSLEPVIALNHDNIIKTGSGAIPRSLCQAYPAHAACTTMVPAGMTAMSTLASADPVQLADVGVAKIPAGGDAQIALSVDAGVTGEILLLSPAGVTASYNGTPMQATTVLGVPAFAISTNGGTGTVSLHNAGSAEATAVAMESVHTSRALSVTGPGGLPAAGTPLTATISLSEAVAGDQVHYRVLDGAGNQLTTGVAAAAAPGSWLAAFTPATAGSHTVVAWTTGTSARSASVVVPVGANDGRGFGAGATWATPDANGDGRFDALEVAVPIVSPAAGTYQVSGDLVGPGGQVIASAGGTATVTAGTGSATLRFDGQALFRAGLSGPYTLGNLVLADDEQNLLAHVSSQATSGVYTTDQFDHFEVEIDLQGFAAEQVDADHNRYAETLNVHGGVRADFAGAYAINARLVGPAGQEIAETQQTTTLAAGHNTFSLTFPWATIAAAGVDGPYTVTDLSVYPIYDAGNGAFLPNAHTTPKYKATGLINRDPQVSAEPATLEGNTTGGYTGALPGATASDPDGDQVTLANNAANPLPLGPNSVGWTATDSYGATGTTVQSVTVRDTTAPAITCPAAVTASTASPALGVPAANDIVDAALTITNNAPATFPGGVTTVTWQARDDSGNVASCGQQVTVNAAYAFTGFFVGATNVGTATTCIVLLDSYNCVLTVGFQLRDGAGNLVTSTSAITGWSWDTPGGSATGLAYNATTGKFTVKIAVTPAQPGTSPKFTVRFADGSSKTLKVTMVS